MMNLMVSFFFPFDFASVKQIFYIIQKDASKMMANKMKRYCSTVGVCVYSFCQHFTVTYRAKKWIGRDAVHCFDLRMYLCIISDHLRSVRPTENFAYENINTRLKYATINVLHFLCVQHRAGWNIIQFCCCCCWWRWWCWCLSESFAYLFSIVLFTVRGE